MVYLLNMALILFWYYTLPKNINGRKKILCIIYCLQWILLSGLRDYSIGADTLAYKDQFELIFNKSWGELFNDFVGYFKGIESVKDPGYAIIEKICQVFIGNNYTLFLIIIACIFTIPMGVWVYRYSDNPCLSFMIYSALFYSFFAITGHRQTIASAFVIFGGYECMRKNKIIPLLILHFIAFFIHKSSICFIVLYFARFIKINKLYWIISSVAIVLSFLFSSTMMRVLGSFMGYDSYIDQYEGAGAYKFAVFLTAIYVITIILYGNVKKVKDVNFWIVALTLALLFTPLTFINPSAMRVVQYFSIFIMLLMPRLIVCFNETGRAIAEMGCYIVLVGAVAIGLPQYAFIF